MIEAVFLQLGYKLVAVSLALAFSFLCLWVMDKTIAGLNFADSLRESSANERNIYYAARVLGVFILVGLVFS